MQKIIILAGGGELPKEVIKCLNKNETKFFCIFFENNPVSNILYKYDHKILNFGKIISELKALYSNDFRKVLMVGNLKRPSLKEIKPDINSIKLIPKFTKALLQGGDNNLLSFCIFQLKRLGLEVIDLRKIIPENFLSKGNQTKKKITKFNLQDIKKGKRILNSMSKFDIGQSIILQEGNVLGIEAIHGTDHLIKFSTYENSKKNHAVLIKLAKINQNLKADLPTIGLKTVKNCKKKSICGIAYSSDSTLFLNKDEILNYCNENDIFLFGL